MSIPSPWCCPQTYKGVSVGRDAHTGASPEKPIDQRSSMASSVEDLA